MQLVDSSRRSCRNALRSPAIFCFHKNNFKLPRPEVHLATAARSGGFRLHTHTTLAFAANGIPPSIRRNEFDAADLPMTLLKKVARSRLFGGYSRAFFTVCLRSRRFGIIVSYPVDFQGRYPAPGAECSRNRRLPSHFQGANGFANAAESKRGDQKNAALPLRTGDCRRSRAFRPRGSRLLCTIIN